MADVSRCGRRKQKNPQRKNAEVDSATAKPVSTDCNDNPTECQNGDANDDVDKKSDVTPEIENNGEEVEQTSDLGDDGKCSKESSSEREMSPRPVGVDDKIKELLNRTDTAVIFPEPPSDQDDAGSEATEDDDHDKELVNGEYMFKCPHCTKGFTRLYILREHIHTQHSDQIHKYVCPKCSANFLLKSQLDKHVAFHSPTCQICSVCHKTFANVYRLQRHMISHDESTDLRKFKCPECGKAFKFKHHLKEHIRIHSGEKPFECPNCGKRFSHSGSFSSHMTSKKCFVMNVKKPEKMGGDITQTMSTSYASTFPEYAAQYIPLTTAAQMSFSASGMRPQFLPYLPYSVASAMIPNLPALYGLQAPIEASLKSANYQAKTVPKTEPDIDGRISPVPNKSAPSMPVKEVTDAKDAVKKVLEIVDATVTQQQKSSDERDKLALSKLAAVASAASGKIASETETKTPVSPDMVSSADILENELKYESESEEKMYCRFCYENFKSPVELHQHERYLCKKSTDLHKNNDGAEQKSDCSTRPSTPITSDEEDDGTEKEQNGRCRSRSLFNEEQLAILKAYYQTNPRPRKFELMKLSNQVGYPKRVVQVWFQNMRARDRRHGKNLLYFSTMAAQQMTQQLPSAGDGLNESLKPGAYIPVVPQPYVSQSIPQGVLYYTAPPQYTQSGINASIAHATPPFQTQPEQVQPLDLSKKSSLPQTNGHAVLFSHNTNSKLQEHLQDMKNFQDSAIFKYMQQEGMFSRNSTNSPKRHNESSHSKQRPLWMAHRVYDRRFQENNTLDHGSYSNSSAQSGDDSDSDYGGSVKRLRKKSWRQVEAEEIEMEFVDSPLTGDEMHPQKKKRKSWKHHKVDIDEGMYACDQCDKMFSKQSSLARHKYEHSGARPFHCDICAKSFKHKHHLTEHRRLHSGEKPFECKKCGKRFSHSGSYSQHMNHRYKYCKPIKAALEAGEEIPLSE